jgi:hypothetical protein
MTDLDKIMVFLGDLGFTFQRTIKPRGATFIPGIYTEAMTLHIDVTQLTPGDILHEAGHVAIAPSMFRRHMVGNFDTLQPITSEYCDTHPLIVDDSGAEDSIHRALLQCGEAEAIAWSYAAALAADIAPQSVFHPNGYDGQSESLLIMLQHKAHFGVHGLAAAKMTSRQIYPAMLRWLQL